MIYKMDYSLQYHFLSLSYIYSVEKSLVVTQQTRYKKNINEIQVNKIQEKHKMK